LSVSTVHLTYLFLFFCMSCGTAYLETTSQDVAGLEKIIRLLEVHGAHLWQRWGADRCCCGDDDNDSKSSSGFLYRKRGAAAHPDTQKHGYSPALGRFE